MNAETKVKATHKNLAAALVAAQADLPAPHKDREVEVFSRRTNSKYKFKYATMAGMMATDKPVLSRHGLGFVQFVQDGALVTRILHESGEHLDCPLPMPDLPSAPQEAGSVITYFKRYSYSAAFGRVADEEDDANIAEGNTYSAKVETRPAGLISDGQWNTLGQLLTASGVSAERLCKFFGVDNLKLLPAAKFDEACEKLTATIAKAKEKADA